MIKHLQTYVTKLEVLFLVVSYYRISSNTLSCLFLFDFQVGSYWCEEFKKAVASLFTSLSEIPCF